MQGPASDASAWPRALTWQRRWRPKKTVLCLSTMTILLTFLALPAKAFGLSTLHAPKLVASLSLAPRFWGSLHVGGSRRSWTRKAAVGPSAGEFPFGDLTPKTETQAAAFLEDYPTYDGRNVTIAVLDTGVDPLAPGLQFTSHGEPKIKDLIDATGSGDVDTRVVRRANDEGIVVSLSGRQLRVAESSRGVASADEEDEDGTDQHQHWANPSGEWRVGLLAGYDIFPRKLTERLREERKAVLAKVRSDALVRAFEERATLVAATTSLGRRKSLLVEEMDAKVEILEAGPISQDDDHAGPLFDVLHWHDGKMWRAVLSEVEFQSSGGEGEKGVGEDRVVDLRGAMEPLSDFREGRQVGSFGGGTDLYYTLRMNPLRSRRDEEEGRLHGQDEKDGHVRPPPCMLSVVTNSGSHGTHVAAIAAAHYPSPGDSKDKTRGRGGGGGVGGEGEGGGRRRSASNRDGVAPGAQVVSVKIGDARFGTMETGQALSRALAIVAKDEDIDIINLSYGDAVGQPNFGRLVELCTEIVRSHGKIFVSSAGNQGPALTSCSAPGSTSPALIGIGAYVSQAMKKNAYSMYTKATSDGLSTSADTHRSTYESRRQSDDNEHHEEKDEDAFKSILAPQTYTFSSRGPSPDGHLGVSLSAPGGALASVPAWCGEGEQIMHGTSMASPNAVGNIALLLSALLQEKITYSPFSVRRALEATATRSPHVKSRRETRKRGKRNENKKVDSHHDEKYDDNANDDDDEEEEEEEDAFSLGHGMLQVADAYHAILEDEANAKKCNHRPSRALDALVDFVVTVQQTSTHTSAPLNSGIYLREPHEQATPRQYPVEVTPLFPPNTSPAAKVAFGTVAIRLVVRCSRGRSGGGAFGDTTHATDVAPAADWVRTAAFLALPAQGRSFKVLVDPTVLPLGAHFAEVLAYDADKPNSHIPLFRLPITVIRNHPQFTSFVRPLNLLSDTSDPSPMLPTPTTSAGLSSSSSSSSVAAAAKAGVLNAKKTKAAVSSTTGTTIGGSKQHHQTSSSEVSIGRIDLGPGRLQRRFLTVPQGATAVEVHVTLLHCTTGRSTAPPLSKPDQETSRVKVPEESADTEAKSDTAAMPIPTAPKAPATLHLPMPHLRTIHVHLMQLIPHVAPQQSQMKRRMVLSPGETGFGSMAVAGGGTLEVSLSQDWASVGEVGMPDGGKTTHATNEEGMISVGGSVAEVKLTWRKLAPNLRHLRIAGTKGFASVEITNHISLPMIAEEASFAPSTGVSSQDDSIAGSAQVETTQEPSLAQAVPPISTLLSAPIAGATELLRPVAKLRTWLSPVRPSASVIRPMLDDRDSWPARPSMTANCAANAAVAEEAKRTTMKSIDDITTSAAYEKDDASSVMPFRVSSNVVNYKPALSAATDTTPDSRGVSDAFESSIPTYELVLEYTFEQPKGYTKHMVTPHLLSAHGELYESAFTGSLTMVYASNDRRLVGMRDAFAPSPPIDLGPAMACDSLDLDTARTNSNDDIGHGTGAEDTDSSSNGGGDGGVNPGGNGGGRQFTVLVQLRHHRSDVLRTFQDVELWLERPLESEVSLGVFQDRSSAVLSQGGLAEGEVSLSAEESPTVDAVVKKGGGVRSTSKVRPLKSLRLMPGQRKVLYVAGPNPDKIPKEAKAGDFLGGDIYYFTTVRNGAGRKYPVSYFVPPKQTQPTSKNGSARSALESLLSGVANDDASSAIDKAKTRNRDAKGGSVAKKEATSMEKNTSEAPLSRTKKTKEAGLESKLADARREWEIQWLAKHLGSLEVGSKSHAEAMDMLSALLDASIGNSSDIGSSDTGSSSSSSSSVSKHDTEKGWLLEMKLVELLKQQQFMGNKKREEQQQEEEEEEGRGREDRLLKTENLQLAILDTIQALIDTVNQTELAQYQGMRRTNFFDDDFGLSSDDVTEDNKISPDDEEGGGEDKAELLATASASVVGEVGFSAVENCRGASDELDEKEHRINKSHRTAKEKESEAAAQAKAMRSAKVRLVKALRHKVAALSRGGLIAGASDMSCVASLKGPLVLSEAAAAGAVLQIAARKGNFMSTGSNEKPSAAAATTSSTWDDLSLFELETDANFAEAVKELGKWEEVGGTSVVGIFYEWAVRRRPAVALKVLNSAIKGGGKSGGHGGRQRQIRHSAISAVVVNAATSTSSDNSATTSDSSGSHKSSGSVAKVPAVEDAASAATLTYGAESELKSLRLLRIRLYKELGLEAHADIERRDFLRRFPPVPGYRPF